MPEIIFSESFAQSLAEVYSDRVRGNIVNMLSLLETSPELGSTNLLPSTRKLLGQDSRRIVVDPFDIFYRVSADGGSIEVIALVDQRRVR